MYDIDLLRSDTSIISLITFLKKDSSREKPFLSV